MACYGLEKALNMLQKESERFGLGEYGVDSDISCDVCCGATIIVPIEVYDNSESIRESMKQFCEKAKYFDDSGDECSKEQFNEDHLCDGRAVEPYEIDGKHYMVIW